VIDFLLVLVIQRGAEREREREGSIDVSGELDFSLSDWLNGV